MLGNGALYFFQDGNLHIDLAADGGTMVFAPATASAVAFGDAWESVACDVLGVGPEVAAVADCGYVTVPENRAAGTEDTIRLAVVRVKSVSDTPGAPLLLGTGGPGGPGLQDVQGAQGPAFLAANGSILEDRDFVLFSQRGTALAEPTLDCPAFSALTIQASMEGMSLEARGQAGRDALVKCAEAFAAEGVDPALVASVVHDPTDHAAALAVGALAAQRQLTVLERVEPAPTPAPGSAPRSGPDPGTVHRP